VRAGWLVIAGALRCCLKNVLPFGGHVLAAQHDDEYENEKQDGGNNANGSRIHVNLLLNEISKSYN
jgi:hypothetical protein